MLWSFLFLAAVAGLFYFFSWLFGRLSPSGRERMIKAAEMIGIQVENARHRAERKSRRSRKKRGRVEDGENEAGGGKAEGLDEGGKV